MAYTPTVWAKGDKVTSARLNKIENGIADKVDKVSGKVLSTNDYTNADKKKVNDISISSPANGQALVYNSSTQKWENKTIGGSGTGQDGYSPTVTVTNITGGHRVSITDVNGTKTFDVMDGTNGTNGTNGSDGFSPTVTVTNITGGHRVSITDVDGTKTFDVIDGTNGTNGVSPTITVTAIAGGHRVSITDATSTTSFDVMDGTGGGDSGGGDSGETTYVNVIPEQTFTPTTDYTALTVSEILIDGQAYRYTVNGVENTGTATLTGGSIILGSYTDYADGAGGAFECLNNAVYYDTKLRTETTIKVDKVVESGGGGGGSSTYYNPLKGKIAAFTGDSLCYGAGYTGGYAKIIGEDNSMTVQNIGVSEGTVVKYQNYFCISESIPNLRADADYVILEGGGNDAWYGEQVIPLGTMTSGYDDTLDTTTFAGALESMIKNTINRFPGKKIGYIFPHKGVPNFSSTISGGYYHMIIDILQKWGIPYFDNNILCPPLGYVDVLKNTYTIGDGVHPNELGYRTFYASQIAEWMKTL